MISSWIMLGEKEDGIVLSNFVCGTWMATVETRELPGQVLKEIVFWRHLKKQSQLEFLLIKLRKHCMKQI